MTITGLTHPDIIDDLLEGLRYPSIIVIEGPPGVGKALFISTLVHEYIERGRGKASIVNFMVSKGTSIRYSKKYGIDLEKYIREDKLRIYEVLTLPFSGEESLTQLYMTISTAAEYAGDGIVALYPADLALIGLDVKDIVRLVGLINDTLETHRCKIILVFTEHRDTRTQLVRKIFESVADYVFRISIEIPEAGAPRRYLTIIKPLQELTGVTRTLELYVEYGRGYTLFSYGILPKYEVKIDPENKVYSDIKFLDELVDGFIRGTIIAVIGSSGSGKTPLLLASSYNMAKRGEKILYISLEEPVNQLVETLKTLGYWYDYVRNNLVLANINPRTITVHSLFNLILQKMGNDPTIVILDGIHTLFKEFGEKAHKTIKDIGYYMKSAGKILFLSLIDEIPEVPATLITTIADGTIRLFLERKDYTYKRIICLEKYRIKYIKPSCRSFTIPFTE